MRGPARATAAASRTVQRPCAEHRPGASPLGAAPAGVMARRPRPARRRVRQPRRCCAPPPRCCCALRAARQPARAPGCAGTRPAPHHPGRVTSDPVCAFGRHTWLLQAHLAAACMRRPQSAAAPGTGLPTMQHAINLGLSLCGQHAKGAGKQTAGACWRASRPPGALPHAAATQPGRAGADARACEAARQWRCGRPAPGVYG